MVITSRAKDKKTVLVTGSAGFIGYHLCLRLINDGWNVIGIDGLTSYYDVALKKTETLF